MDFSSIDQDESPKQLNKIGEGSNGDLYPEGGSIGVPIEECPLCETEFIPYLVKVCCDVVNARGMDIVGIYRVPGNKTVVSYLTEQVNKGVGNFALEDQCWQDVSVVSSLLKSFFLKLPDPLFTVGMYSSFIEASKIDMAPRRMNLLRKLIRELPEVNLETLKYLTSHLCRVAKQSTFNKMEAMNLAIEFGPILVRTTEDNMVPMVTDMAQQCRIIETLLCNWEYFFKEEEVELKKEADGSQQLPGTCVSIQSLMLANLHKMEDAGKVDVLNKDILPSIISSAKRAGMKESSGECKWGSSLSIDRVDTSDGGRRESEAVNDGMIYFYLLKYEIMTNVQELSRFLVPCLSCLGQRSGAEKVTLLKLSYLQGTAGRIVGGVEEQRGGGMAHYHHTACQRVSVLIVGGRCVRSPQLGNCVRLGLP